jgi:hypothetical protein
MSTVLSELVQIRGRYHRSVNLTADWQSRGSLTEFLPTKTITGLAEQICLEACRFGGTRAWSLTGPYGAGKSAFALFLADILASRKPGHPESGRLRNRVGLANKEFYPVLLTAERAPLREGLTSALAAARKDLTGTPRGRPRRDPLLALRDVAEAARARRKTGLLVVVDELGKFLEFASARPEAADVFLLQQMAEEASRSQIPIVFITILHSGFADYLPLAEEVRRNEWQKVQGRFQDVPYQLPAEQVLELVAASIQTSAPPRLKAAWHEAASVSYGRLQLHDAILGRALGRHTAKCVPLHPVALALLWPLFRSKGAQNERSLFSFLTSSEPFGFQSFLENTQAEGYSAPFYRLHDLYDYVTHALGISTFRGDQARRWAQIDQAISRLPADAPPGSGELIKAIGLLEILGRQAGLRSDVGTLSEAVTPGVDVPVVLQYLQDQSVLLFRRHLDAFSLWDGSDFDIEAAFRDAQARVRSSTSVHRQLERLFRPRPWVVQRHYLESGTMRYFEVAYVDTMVGKTRDLIDSSSDADGRILFCVPPGGQLALAASEETLPLSDVDGKPVIMATPRQLRVLSEDLLEVEAWEYVSDHSPALTSDQAARQEVRSRLKAAKDKLSQKVGPQLGLPGHLFDPSLVEWTHGASRFEGQSAEEFKRWLSAIMDTAYSKAPVLKNELLNRSVLSSAASRARRNLLEGMLTRGSVERLGFEGYPPERSMYEAMLRSGGFHQPTDAAWRWQPPQKTWRMAYGHIEKFVRGASNQRKPLCNLYEELKRPPFGMREGPLPVLLVAFLLERADETALYEEGVLVPELRVEVLERLLRRPELFEVRSHKLTADQAKALTLLSELLLAPSGLRSGARPEKALIPVVRSLVGSVAGLTPYAKQTRRLEPGDAVAVRDLLLDAKDPSKLLFVDLPGALGIEALTISGTALFVERLRDRVRVLGRAHAALLDDIEQQLRGVFSLSGTAEAAYGQLQHRARVVQGMVSEPKLRTFVLEASRDLAGRDWREGLARAVKDGLPPTHWKDPDVSLFQVRLREIASDFLRLEELAAEQGRTGARRVLRIGLLDETGAETRRVIPILDDQDPEVGRLMKSLSVVLRSATNGSADDAVTQLEALGRLAVELMWDHADMKTETQ